MDSQQLAMPGEKTWEAMASAVSATGTDEHVDRLIDLISAEVPHDFVTVTRYSTTKIPEFVKLYDEYKDRGFVVLGVSTDDDPETLRAYAADMKMNYPVLVGRDNEAFLDSFGPLWGLPTSYFIGRDGAVCGKQIGPATKEDFEKAIKALL